MKRRPQWLALVTLSATVVAVLVLGGSAAAHTSSVHWITLKKGTDSSARSTTFGHGNFTLKLVAYFDKVTRTTAFLDHVTFTTCPDVHINGGLMFAYNSNESHRYDADTGRTYYNCGSKVVQVDRRFEGGSSNGNVAITVEKRNYSSYCAPAACDAHTSYTVFYVP
jgi:hypothetical protein